MEPRQAEFAVFGRHAGAKGWRRLGYYEWGEPGNPRVALCLHGLSRNARDFDWLAQGLARTHRVIAIDCAGRGRSERLKDPAGYQQATYVDDIVDLLKHLGIAEVDWIGTSMGGLMGMTAAASEASKGMVRRLVLNDIGPFLPGKAMDRIGTYVGRAPLFADLAAAKAYQSTVTAEWHALTEEQRAHLARHSVRPHRDGGYEIHYDPAIGAPLHKGSVPDLKIWERWDAVGCPVLVLRGASSEILLPETAEEMKRRGPGATVIEIAGVGHTPSLMTEEQIETIARFLDE
jgi:pimeloyl-ACP methyl ester carboxylesterase